MSPLLFVVIAIVGDAAFDHIGRDKRPTMTMILFTWAFGGGWYWLRLKPQLRRAS